ncbi:MAG: hypothetical protein ABI267_10210 [Ginsengibacter sp.]
MEISITSHEKKNYLLIETKANVETKEDLIRQSELLYDEIAKHDFKKILVDETETTLPNELTSYFDLVKNYVQDFPPEIRELKIATVIDKKFKEVSASWETLCRSRGLNYSSFTSFDDAEIWLME